MTQNINLFDLFTVDRREVERNGGVFFEVLNANADGVVFIPVTLSHLVNETLSNISVGELQ